jgi:hypothetical protein
MHSGCFSHIKFSCFNVLLYLCIDVPQSLGLSLTHVSLTESENGVAFQLLAVSLESVHVYVVAWEVFFSSEGQQQGSLN